MPRGRRDDTERAIIEALEAAGCSVLQLEDPDDEGVSDLLVGVPGGQTVLGGIPFPGVPVLMEVKSARGRLRPGQEEFAARWPTWIPVVRSPEEALAVLGLTAKRIPRAARNVAQAGS